MSKIKEINPRVTEFCSENEMRSSGQEMDGHPRRRQYPRPHFVGREIKRKTPSKRERGKNIVFENKTYLKPKAALVKPDKGPQEKVSWKELVGQPQIASVIIASRQYKHWRLQSSSFFVK